MNTSHKKVAAGVALLFGSLLFNGLPVAQAESVQVLDTVILAGKDVAIELNPERPPNFIPLILPDLVNDPGRDFVDCEANTINGLTCIDGENVRNWPNPIGSVDPLSGLVNSTVLFSCGNPALPLNNRKGNACTAIARDAQGGIYIGGRLNGTANIVLKVVVDSNDGDPGGCPDPVEAYTAFTDGTNYWCFAKFATGRPRVEDIDVIEGSQAAGFSGGEKQLLVLEEKKTVLIYKNFDADPRDTEVREVASGKRDFGLQGNEKIVNAALMEHSRPSTATDRPDESDFFVIVATDRGRLISILSDGSPAGVPVVELADYQDQGASPAVCPAGEASFDVAEGPDAGLVYATDRNSCLLHVLVKESTEKGDLILVVDSSLSTATDDSPAVALSPPLTISVSPGIGFDLRGAGCADAVDGCTFISGEGGGDAATLLEVTVVSDESGVTVYQAKGIPFCPYKPLLCQDILLDPAAPLDDREIALAYLVSEGVLIKLPGANSSPSRPEEYIFDTTRFLPQEILDRFTGLGTGPGEIPPLWMLPDFRAQIDNKFFFEALFFITEARTDDVMTLELDVSELQGFASRGCETALDLPPGFVGLDRLLDWDVTTRVSERDPSISLQTIPPPPMPKTDNHQNTMVNAGCGTTRNRTGGISMFAYNLEMSGCPGTDNGSGNLVFDPDSSCVLDDTNLATAMEVPDDTVFAKSYVKHYDELRAHRVELVCMETPQGDDDAILSQSDCDMLEANWLNGKDKLVKALEATIQPKNSAGAQNFGAVQSQLANYRDILDAASTLGRPDLVNRVGEQGARLDTLEHLLIDKVLPSIPPDGFDVDDGDLNWSL